MRLSHTLISQYTKRHVYLSFEKHLWPLTSAILVHIRHTTSPLLPILSHQYKLLERKSRMSGSYNSEPIRHIQSCMEPHTAPLRYHSAWMREVVSRQKCNEQLAVADRVMVDSWRKWLWLGKSVLIRGWAGGL
eukprot:scaffold312384_cov39-Prasinocladus_malaysianus.AAC.2